MQCSATSKTSGSQCGRHAIPGGNVCKIHGGGAPQVKQAAMRRLLEAIDPAASELIRIALNGESEAVRVRAIQELFERAGFGEAKRVEHDGGLDITINGVSLQSLL